MGEPTWGNPLGEPPGHRTGGAAVISIRSMPEEQKDAFHLGFLEKCFKSERYVRDIPQKVAGGTAPSQEPGLPQ